MSFAAMKTSCKRGGDSPMRECVSYPKKLRPETEHELCSVTEVKTLVEDNKHNEPVPKPYLVSKVKRIIKDNEHSTKACRECIYSDGSKTKLHVQWTKGPLDFMYDDDDDANEDGLERNPADRAAIDSDSSDDMMFVW